jgi:hypothetical protein
MPLKLFYILLADSSVALHGKPYAIKAPPSTITLLELHLPRHALRICRRHLLSWITGDDGALLRVSGVLGKLPRLWGPQNVCIHQNVYLYDTSCCSIRASLPIQSILCCASTTLLSVFPTSLGYSAYLPNPAGLVAVLRSADRSPLQCSCSLGGTCCEDVGASGPLFMNCPTKYWA